MIVDDMVAAAPYLKRTFDQAHIVRVPFESFPFQPDMGRNSPGVNWTDSERLQRLLPQRPDGTIEIEWLKMPFPLMLIVSQNAERGALLCIDLSYGTKIGLKIEPMSGTHPGIFVVGLGLLRGLVLPGCAVELIEKDGYLAARYPRTYHTLREMLSCFDSWLRDSESPYKRFGPSECPEPDTFQKDVILDSMNISGRSAATLALLGCSNIVAQSVELDARLQKSRVKKGQLPLYRHHVLTLRSVSKRLQGGGPVGRGEPLASHWVRGHFKVFTKDRPLFGRVTGRLWWTPHLAGQAARFVSKEYKVLDPEIGLFASSAPNLDVKEKS